MAAYLRFFLARGSAGDQRVLSAASLDRMEIPTSDWAAKAGYSLELRERALAHKVGGDVISRYNRDTLLAQRAEMMTAYADYALPTS